MSARRPQVGDLVRLTDGTTGRVIEHVTDGVECWLVRCPGLDSWATIREIVEVTR